VNGDVQISKFKNNYERVEKTFQNRNTKQMVAKKRKSKRQTLKQKYKIVKRTKEHHRKLKKGAVLHTSTKKKTENHIPNAWPYKEDLLKEISAAKDRMEEVRVEQKQKRQEEIVSIDP
jgi:nuclear GTP-binding protein